jgi:hypothetical protein
MGKLKAAYEALAEAGQVCEGLYGRDNEKVRAVYDEMALLGKEIK